MKRFTSSCAAGENARLPATRPSRSGHDSFDRTGSSGLRVKSTSTAGGRSPPRRRGTLAPVRRASNGRSEGAALLRSGFGLCLVPVRATCLQVIGGKPTGKPPLRRATGQWPGSSGPIACRRRRTGCRTSGARRRRAPAAPPRPRRTTAGPGPTTGSKCWQAAPSCSAPCPPWDCG
jgi:hypothetical protein